MAVLYMLLAFSSPFLALLLIVAVATTSDCLLAGIPIPVPKNWVKHKASHSRFIQRLRCFNTNLKSHSARRSIEEERSWLAENSQRVMNLTTHTLLQFGQPLIKGNDSFLHVGTLNDGIVPQPFHQRFQFPPDILIRQSYTDVYDLIIGRTKTDENGVVSGGGVITGVPGIGKSYFGMYFLYRFLTDLTFVDKRISYELDSGRFIHFIPSPIPGKYECYSLEPSLNFYPDIVIADMEAVAAPRGAASFHLVLSDPDEKRYKQLLKRQPSMYWLPPWSFAELQAVRPDVSSWKSSFDLFGGVPGTLFKKSFVEAEWELNMLIASTGEEIAISVLEKGCHATVDQFSSYMLIHRAPKVINGTTIYLESTSDFATYAIVSRLVKLLYATRQSSLLSLFDVGAKKAIDKLGVMAAGSAFEFIIRDPNIIGGGQFPAISLSTMCSVNQTIKVPYLSSDFDIGSIIEPNICYRPLKINYPGIDLFVLTASKQHNGKFDLIIGQTTLSQTHAINVSAIGQILSSLPSNIRVDDIDQVIMWFLVPKDVCFQQEQPLAASKSEGLAQFAHILPRMRQVFSPIHPFGCRHKTRIVLSVNVTDRCEVSPKII